MPAQPKKKATKQPSPPSSDEEEDQDLISNEEYDSEAEYESEEDDSEPVPHRKNGEMIEVDREHLLNYESDDSDEDDEGMEDSDDEFEQGLKKQKDEALVMNDTWGSKKKNFYGRDKKADDESSSEDDQDEYQEALRLQKVRAKKLQQSMAQSKVEEESEQDDAVMESSEDSDDSEAGASKGKLGDRLFAEEGESQEASLAASLKQMKDIDPKLLKQIIERDSPELQGLLTEFQQALDQLNNKLRPILEKAKSRQIETKHGMTYLEMKYNLLLSYCTFLSFYLLLKIEGKPVQDHPVIYKLAHIKTLLEKLRPLDQKLQYQVDKLLRTASVAELNTEQNKPAALDALQYKPNLKNLKANEQESEGDDYDQEEEESDDETDKKKFKAAKLNPVFYEDKETKKERQKELYEKKKMSKSAYIDEVRREMFDEPEEIHLGGAASKRTKLNRELDMIEEMEQEHFKRMSFNKKELKSMKQRQKEEIQERLDDIDDLRGLDKVLGGKDRRAQKEMDQDAENMRFSKSLNSYLKNAKKQKTKQNDDMLGDDSNFKKIKKGGKKDDAPVTKKQKLTFNDVQVKNQEGDQLYEGQKEKMREKKAARKEVEKSNKEDRLKEVDAMDKDIQRNISYDIMKSKGLTRKRKKIDRNPRVKLREKYRKALIKRGSKVQEFKEGPQGRYAGEKTGLKAGLIKSTALS